MKRLIPLLYLVLVVSCSPMDAAKLLLPGGGVNTAASVQAGESNLKGVGNATLNEQKVSDSTARTIEQSTGTTKVRTESAGSVTVNEKDSPWLIITIALVSALCAAGWIHGWLTPSPRERKLLARLNKIQGSSVF